MIEIPLTRGLVALVDDEDAERVWPYKWHARPDKRTFYVARCMRLDEGMGKRRQSLHAFLTGWSLVDHRNGNGLDNRRCNLREATQLRNLGNMRKRGGSSRFKGVRWRSERKRWMAEIGLSGRHTFLGYYTEEEAAAFAYDGAARAAFGEFACLNFPRQGEQSALHRGSL